MAITERIIKDWGGETLITDYDHATQSWIIIAIHSTLCGPAAGGTRMKNYNSLDEAINDALLLSKAMTHKYATVDMPWGGGKAVIAIQPGLANEDRTNLLLRFGALIKGLNGKFYAGPDVGTSSEDMNIIYKVGAPYVFSRTKDAGGAGSSAVPTAYGVFAGIQTTCEQLFGTTDLHNRSILIQGVGNVGSFLLKLLRESGAKVSFSETNPDLIQQYVLEGYHFVPASLLFETECDIFCPCAQGGILNSETIGLLKSRGVVGAANNQLSSEEDDHLLFKKGILYAPDYVVNLGGAMGITAIEAEGLSEVQSFANVANSISKALSDIFNKSRHDGIPTTVAAKAIANAKIRNFDLNGMNYKGHGLNQKS